MRIGQAPLTFLDGMLGMLACGIFWADRCPVPLALLLPAVAFFSCLSVYLAWHNHAKTYIAAGVLFLVLGAGRFLQADSLPDTDISHFVGDEVSVAGMVTGAPAVVENAKGDKKLRYVIQAEEAGSTGKMEAASGKAYISMYIKSGESQPEVRIGDRLEASGKLHRLHGYGDPGQIDTVRAARAQGITARLSVSKRSYKVVPQDKELLRRHCEAARSHYQALMAEAMPSEDAAAVFAMLFGGYAGIRPELLEAFTTTGIVHILSVSGSHITLLAATLAWLGRILCWRRGVTAGLAALAIIMYCALAGFVSPALRAGIMGILAFMAMTLAREGDAKRFLALTGIGMLSVSPFLLFDVSFQLSFAATAGLLYAGPRLQKLLGRFLPAIVAGSLSITVSAQLFSLPFLAWYFNQLSLSSLLANLLVVPILENIIVIGLLAGLVGFLLPFLARLVFLLGSLMLGLSYEITRLLARLPASQIYVPSGGIPAGVVYYALLAIWLQEKPGLLRIWLQKHRRHLAMLLLLLAAFFLGRQLLLPPELAVHFLDVGQGDAALIVTPHGHAFMIDTGGTRDAAFDVGGRVDVPYLKHYGIRRLDYIFLTHAHEDHAAGAGGIVRAGIPIDEVVIGHEDRRAYLKSMLLSESSPLLSRLAAAEAGQRIVLDGVTIEVLYAPSLPAGSTNTGNEVSNVFRVSYGAASFIFTGDLVKEQEKAILASAIPVHSTVLKIGHHGSRTSTSPAFLEAVQPQFAMICAGQDNPFGHPHQETLDLLQQAGIKVYRTDHDGATVFHTDGNRLWIEKFYHDG